MKLKDLLREKRSTIFMQWFEETLKAYPAVGKKFFREKMSLFDNPVGSTIRESLGGLYGQLVQGWEEEKILPFLDPLIRLRAVQEISPSQAVSFVPALKKIIRLELAQEMRHPSLLAEFEDFAAEVDRLTLLSFDLYMSCREKVHEMKVKELRAAVRLPES